MNAEELLEERRGEEEQVETDSLLPWVLSTKLQDLPWG